MIVAVSGHTRLKLGKSLFAFENQFYFLGKDKDQSF